MAEGTSIAERVRALEVTINIMDHRGERMENDLVYIKDMISRGKGVYWGAGLLIAGISGYLGSLLPKMPH